MKNKIEKMKKQSTQDKDKPHTTEKIELEDDQNDLNLLKNQKNKNLNQNKMRQYEVNKYLENVETPFEYKLHLQLLAKDLNKNPKLKNL